MPQVQLSDAAYRAAVQRSAAHGFATVDEYVADVVLNDLADPGVTPNLDHLFTPERLAQIAEGEADLAAGRTFTPAELDAAFAKRRAQWLKFP